MIALLVIDMQVGLFTAATPQHDSTGVLQRVNMIIAAIRARRGSIIFVQHDDAKGGNLEPGSPGWELLPALERLPEDIIIRKTACDAFYKTELADVLAYRQVRELAVVGCATDFCVDTTIRAAASRAYDVTVVADGHTTADRSHLSAAAIIEHHNWMWRNLMMPGHPVRVMTAADLAEELASWS